MEKIVFELKTKEKAQRDTLMNELHTNESKQAVSFQQNGHYAYQESGVPQNRHFAYHKTGIGHNGNCA